jgi:dolichyl-phosphate beta-glucosyltransferase
MDISVILPVFNSRDMAIRNSNRMTSYLSGWCASFEIILVDDGSRPQERLLPEELPPEVRLIQLPHNLGKGAAVRCGMLEARGKVRVYTDIDLPFDLAAVRYAYGLIMDKGFHFVAGDRTLPTSVYSNTLPFYRKVVSRIFSKFVTLFVIGGIYDSQCGFKAFSGMLARSLFPLLTIDRFSFDVEIYYLVLKYNIVIRRIPVRLQDQEKSTVNIFKQALPMAARIMGIPFKWYAGRYASKGMEEFFDKPYWDEGAVAAPERR